MAEKWARGGSEHDSESDLLTAKRTRDNPHGMATNAKTEKAAGKTADVSHSLTSATGVTAETALSGKPGPGPKVGDSAFQTASEDHLSRGTPTSTSDGTGAPPDTIGASEGEKAKKPTGKQTKVKMGDIVGFVTSGRVPGKIRPAIVVRPSNPEGPNADRCPIDITVFPDSGKFPNNDHLGNVHFREGVLYDENGADGTWHLIDDSDDVIETLEESDATQIERKQEKRNRR